MRRFSFPFPLLVFAAANAVNLTLLLAFGGPFGQGSAARATTPDRGARWIGTLAPPATPADAVPGAGPMQGSAAMRPGPAGSDTHVTVDLASAATVPLRMPTEGRCSVRVSSSPVDPGTIVACANLAARSR